MGDHLLDARFSTGPCLRSICWVLENLASNTIVAAKADEKLLQIGQHLFEMEVGNLVVAG